MLETIFKNPKEKTDFIISIVVVVLFGAGIIIGSFGNWDADELAQSFLTEDAKTEILESESEPIAQAVTYDDVDAYEDEETRSDDRMMSPLAQDSSYAIAHTARKSIEPKSTMAEEDEMAISPISSHTEEVVDTIAAESEEISETPLEVEADDDAISESADESIATEETEAAPMASDSFSSAEEIKEDLNCQIVVGAYSSKENRTRKLDELLKDNYVTYTYKQRGLYVASVKVPCDEKVRRNILKEIRKKHAAGAFIPRK